MTNDTDRLIAAALAVIKMQLQKGHTPSYEMQQMIKAGEPFRTRPAKVGFISVSTRDGWEDVPAIERTPEVNARLGKSAGVSRDKVWEIVCPYITPGQADGRTKRIMALIADSAVEVE